MVQSPFPNCIIKLDDTNYLIWRTHTLPMLHGYQLDKYALGSDLAFMKMITDVFAEISETSMANYIKK